MVMAFVTPPNQLGRKSKTGKDTRVKACPFKPPHSSDGGGGGVQLESFGLKGQALALVSFPAIDFLSSWFKGLGTICATLARGALT